jgi:hypothetical protein
MFDKAATHPRSRYGSPFQISFPGAFRAAVAALLTLAAVPFLGAAEKASEQVNAFYGSLSYRVPIEVPSWYGIEPRLALGYSSEGRNGLVGVGWSVSGFSVIERVNAGRGTPRFDTPSTDTYLLDGAQLLACTAGSTSPSCTSGGTHFTREESYLRTSYDPGHGQVDRLGQGRDPHRVLADDHDDPRHAALGTDGHHGHEGQHGHVPVGLRGRLHG